MKAVPHVVMVRYNNEWGVVIHCRSKREALECLSWLRRKYSWRFTRIQPASGRWLSDNPKDWVVSRDIG